MKSDLTQSPFRINYRVANNNNNGEGMPNTSSDSAGLSSQSINDTLGAANFTVQESNPEINTQQTTTFKESTGIYSVDISAERDSTYNDGYSDNVSLGDFLSRPVKIHEDNWNVGYETSNFNEAIDPWVLWQSDARVKAKLQNYAYGSFDLKVRFMINGSPFQYGRLMLIYIPYGETALAGDPRTARNQTANIVRKWHDGSASGRVETTFQHFSTYPHAFLNPSTNQVVEMTLPFVWHNNYIALNGTPGIAKQSLGIIQMYDINPLRIANTSAPTQVNFSVYAWAENIKVCMPTEFTPTSRNMRSKKDEYEDTKISTVASAVASAAGHLVRVPIIGPFARATEIGASMAGKIARIFGFSAPIMIENPGRCQLKNHGRLANISGEDASYSLALDPKQEITVDPRTVGVAAHDEMDIKSIITREQFLARCEWIGDHGQFTTSGAEKIIFASLCSPNQFHRTGTMSNYQQVMDCPGGWIANMFGFWKGSITYRVEVVSTRMHSGRLKLQFDPFCKNAALTVAEVNTEDVNARYTVILDLQESNEVEFTVDYNSRRPWLKTQDNYTNSTFQPYKTDLDTFDLQAYFNPDIHMGIFTISIVNELVSPIATNDVASATHAPVQVNVFCKMGPDMQFAQPSQQGIGWSKFNYAPTSKEYESVVFTPTSAVSSSDPTTTSVVSSSILGEDIDENNNLVFFGERIVSLRALIKRYNMVFTGVYSSATAQGFSEIVTRYLPFTPAFVTKDKARRNSYLSYVMPAFLIARGSTRYKLNYMVRTVPGSPVDFNGQSFCFVDRWDADSPLATVGHTVYQTSSLSSQGLDDAFPHGYNGACYTANAYQPTLEFQLPFYSNTRFMLGCNFINVDNDANETMTINPGMTQLLCAKNVYTGIGAHQQIMQQWHSAGDDFSLHFFLGVPSVFIDVTP